jgi:voltage-gated potassium channel
VDTSQRNVVLRRAALALAIFAFLLSAGFVAFLLAGGESAEEAFYRAFGAFTTANVIDSPNSAGERAIAAVLTVAGGLFYLALVGGVVQTLFREALIDVLRERRMKDEIRGLRKHYVVCGYGRVGKAVVSALLDEGRQVVVVEQKEQNWPLIEGHPSFRDNLYLVRGDADDPNLLADCGLSAAAALITCTGSDAENLYIALAARRCCPDIPIVARASDEDAEKNLRAATTILDSAITPYTSAGRDLVREALKVRRHE